MAKKVKLMSARVAKPAPPRNCVYLTYTEHRTGGEVRAGQENDDWPDHEDEYIDWSLIGCHRTRDEKHWLQEEVNIDFDAKVGSTVWVVYVRYGTGCTFGHTNGAWTILGVYEHQGQAEKIKKAVYDKTYNNNGYVCWEGYFESFESCEVEAMTLEGQPDVNWDLVKL